MIFLNPPVHFPRRTWSDKYFVPSESGKCTDTTKLLLMKFHVCTPLNTARTSSTEQRKKMPKKREKLRKYLLTTGDTGKFYNSLINSARKIWSVLLNRLSLSAVFRIVSGGVSFARSCSPSFHEKPQLDYSSEK